MGDVDKQKYNDLLMRAWKAVAYLDGQASTEEKEKWIPKFKELLDEINSMITGDFTDNEILYGFQI